MEDLTGKQLGSYQVVAPLGEGGMAAVYKAHQPSMDRYVALKILPRQFANSPEFLARFRQEARMLARLQHPHILPVFDFGDADGYTFIAMPLLQSGALTQRMTGAPMLLSQVTSIITQVGDALDYAHTHGLVHRDVKPSNVLLDERGNCLLTDFGIARMVEGTANLTGTGNVIGTPSYMSPEQGAGKPVDARSDIYALGVVLFELATGRVPYSAETPVAVVIKHMQDPLPLPRKLNPALPEAVERVILKALAKRPEDRFQKMSELVQALQRATAGVPDAKAAVGGAKVGGAAFTPVTPVTPLPMPAQAGDTARLGRPLPWLAGGAILVLLLGAFAALRLFGGSGPSSSPATATIAVVGGGVETPVAEAVATATPLPPATNAPVPSATPLAAASETPLAPPTATLAGADLPTATTAPPTQAPAVPPTATPALIQPATAPPLRTDFTDTFNRPAVTSRLWQRVNSGGEFSTYGALNLSSKEAAFPLVVSAVQPFPASGDFRVRVVFRYSDLSACGTGILITSYRPAVSASIKDGQAFEQNAERTGFTAGVWQDHTHGMSVWFRDAAERRETPVLGGQPNIGRHELLFRRAGDLYELRLDGQSVLTARSELRPAFISIGNGTRIDTCAGYWSSLSVESVTVTSMADGEPAEAAATRTTVADACVPKWFFAPAPLGCLEAYRKRAAQLQTFERGRVIYLSDQNASFVFFGDGSWFSQSGGIDDAIATYGGQLGKETSRRRDWQTCGGHTVNRDRTTAYIVDPDRRALSWSILSDGATTAGWSYVRGATFLGCP